MASHKEVLYEKIYHNILQAIQNGEIAPGERLGSEVEIATRFGVSCITSKRALNQLAHDGYIVRYPGRGSYVQQVPRQPARDLAGAAPGLVAVIMPELSASYGVRLLASVQHALHKAGFDVVIGLSHGSQTVESEEIDRFSRLGVKGYVIFPVNGEFYNSEILRLHLDGMPLVLVDKPLSKIPVSAVWSQNEEAGYTATQYLIERGHRRIAFLSPTRANTETLESRYAGYARALNDAGLSLETELILDDLPSERFEDHFSPDDRGYESLLHFFENHADITAVLAAEYRIGLESLKVFRRLNIGCPEQISLMTFDGPWPLDVSMQLTHMRQDEWTMGQTAVQFLLNQISHGERDANLMAIPTVLVEGFSTRTISQWS